MASTCLGNSEHSKARKQDCETPTLTGASAGEREGRYRGAGERKRLAPWSPDGSNWTIAPEPSTSGIVATRKPSRHRAPALHAVHVGRHPTSAAIMVMGNGCGKEGTVANGHQGPAVWIL
jgi:hypothetical protein